MRPPLPWRFSELTECGLVAAGVVSVITREELFARLKKWGQERTRFATCVTCYNTANRWATWDTDPIEAMRRELEHAQRFRQSNKGSTDIVARELEAIAVLIDRHRDEFDQLVAVQSDEVEGVVSLANRRANR